MSEVVKKRSARHRMCLNATAFGELCLLLNKGEYTKQQLADKTGLTIGTVIKVDQYSAKTQVGPYY